MAEDKKPEEQITSMRDVRLSEGEKRNLYIIGAVILIAFAVSIVIADSIIGQSSAIAYYPGGCGKQNSYSAIYSCVGNLANTTLNTSVCGYLPNAEQSSCAYSIALKSQNASKCFTINPYDPYYTQCILSINQKLKNLGLCGYLQQQSALPCIYNISAGFNFSNPSLCSELSNVTYRSACTNLYYYKEALGTSDERLCAYVQDQVNYTTYQFLSYNASGQFNANVSSTLNSYFALSAYNLTPQNYCYYQLAIKENNATVCGSIGGALSAECGAFIAGLNASRITFDLNATNYTAACGAYVGYKANLCTSEYALSDALRTKTAAPCFLLNTTNGTLNRDRCILSVAINASNATMCLQISNASLQGLCKYVQNATSSG